MFQKIQKRKTKIVKKPAGLTIKRTTVLCKLEKNAKPAGFFNEVK